MKTGSRNASQNKKPALRRAKAWTNLPDNLSVLPLLDAWLARPSRQPENLMEILRNRSN